MSTAPNDKVPRTLPTRAESVPGVTASDYPKEFQNAVQGRVKRKLGDLFGLNNFGVNHTTLPPGASSALLHCHQLQDEMVYILQGTATLQLGEEEYEMKAGDCVGFPASALLAHCIRNQSDQPVVFLEIGDRTRGDCVDYPNVDLKVHESDGKWQFTHKNGTPYET